MNDALTYLYQLDSLHIELDSMVDGYKASVNLDRTRIAQWQERLAILKGACDEIRRMQFLSYWWYLDQAINRLQSLDPSLSKVLISMRLRLDNDGQGYIEVDPTFHSHQP